MKPRFDEQQAKSLIGKYILIGVTIYDHRGNFLEQKQFHGDIVSITEKRGVVIKLRGTGEHYFLPSDLSAFKRAKPGEYRLRSTGEIVVNPDLITTWILHQPPPKEET